MPDWHRHLDTIISPEQLDAARLAEVAEEIAEHLDDRYHALLAEGVTGADAEQQVLSELRQGALGIELKSLLQPAPTFSASW